MKDTIYLILLLVIIIVGALEIFINVFMYKTSRDLYVNRKLKLSQGYQLFVSVDNKFLLLKDGETVEEIHECSERCYAYYLTGNTHYYYFNRILNKFYVFDSLSETPGKHRKFFNEFDSNS